jgi:hypothetical protein
MRRILDASALLVAFLRCAVALRVGSAVASASAPAPVSHGSGGSKKRRERPARAPTHVGDTADHDGAAAIDRPRRESTAPQWMRDGRASGAAAAAISEDTAGTWLYMPLIAASLEIAYPAGAELVNSAAARLAVGDAAARSRQSNSDLYQIASVASRTH